MSEQAYAERLSKALERTSLFEPVRASFGSSAVTVIGRVQKDNKEKWIQLIEKLERAAESESRQVHAWQSHVCQRYFLKEFPTGEKRLVYAWNISIQSTQISAALDAIMVVLKDEPLRTVVPGELEEMPMTGLIKDRNVPNEKGRGAYFIESEDGKNDFRVTR